ncbi:hypothetical protein [Halomonas casei]|uniref:hypothetical protein n=1 Tax=Halomonas casei TaxID=2742613 RepID=UPI003CF768F2
MSAPIKHVQVGIMTVGQLGVLVALLRPYAGHTCASHVVNRAVRLARNQPLIGPVKPIN